MADVPEKVWSTAQARAALGGFQLRRSVEPTGRVRYAVSNWGLMREFTRFDAVSRFLDRAIGVAR